LPLLVAALIGCSERQKTEPAEMAVEPASNFRVYAVNYPLAYFAQRIAGDLADVTFPAPSDVDPAFWSPMPEVVTAYQEADLILLNGAGYARWVQRASLPRAKLVDTSRGLREQFIALDAASIHSHGPEGAHSHTGTAFTTWLDPALAEEQARAILAAFERARPHKSALFTQRFEELRSDLRELDAELAASARSIADAPLLFSHPVYSYLARRYRLNGQSLVWEPDRFPDERMWQELDAMREDHPARWMLWESEPLEATVQALRSRGIETLVYQPCANAPVVGDFISVMRQSAAGLAQIASRVNAKPPQSD
jgi:zinc transport system substrate-binding protein